LVHAVGHDEPLATGPRGPIGADPPLNDVVRRRAIVRLESGWPSRGGQYPSSVLVPLVAGGRAVGVLGMNFHDARYVAPDEQEFLLTAGRRTADALLRAQVYLKAESARAQAEDYRLRAEQEVHERQKAEAALRESETRYRSLAARTSRLYSLSAALSESISVQAVARAVVRHGMVVAGASASAVNLLVEDGSQFETLYAENYAPDTVEAAERFIAEPGLCSTAAIETREPVLVGSFIDCQAKYPRSAAIAADGGFSSVAFLPLVVEDIAIGVLAFHFTAPVNFDDEYRALLVSVAHHCAQAMDRARLYESAERARIQAEEANRSKDDFLSTVSHELRTPLTAVLGWAAILRRGGLDPTRAERAVEAIYNNATRQTQMIDELLDVSRIVSGRAALEVQELDLRDSIRTAVDAIMPLAESKRLELRLLADPSVPLLADPRRLEQVWLNLLTNAVKFTPSGGVVTVNVAVSGRSVEVRVADTGTGIEPGFLPHVFERFRQAESTMSRGVSGLGLGLFIARNLVLAHGGDIRVESAGAGTGATFIVTLPAAFETAAGRSVSTTAFRNMQVDPSIPGSLAGIRVLLVDDELDVRELMATAVEKAGATVFSAASTREAIAALSEADIDVLLADIAMPGEDGYDLIRQVRSMSAGRAARIPAAAVTACAREDERQRILAAGFQLHLAKPLEPDQLVHAVAQLARAGAVASS
jgi:signal transduction histidine kinase/ActR/RegA family two-component response regulator